MRYIDIILLSLRIFRIHRLRTILTILAISVGVAVIVFLVALGYGLQEVTIEKIANIEAFSALDVTTARPDVLPLDDQAIAKFQKIDQVVLTRPLVGLSSQIVAGGQRADVALSGADPEFFSLDGLNFIAGARYSAADNDSLVVSRATLKLIGTSEGEAVGQLVTLSIFDKKAKESAQKQAQSFRIVGVIAEETVAQAFVPLNVIKPKLLESIQYDLVKVKVANRQQINHIKSVIAALGFSASAVVETIEEVTQVFRYLRLILAGLGLIALLVASIGMFNTMTISLLERIKEIGVMRALGAGDQDIWKLFLTEAWIIGIGGSILGVVVGIGSSQVANLVFNIFAKTLGGEAQSVFLFPPVLVVGMIIFAQLVAVATGLYPAYRAVKVNPLDALRYE